MPVNIFIYGKDNKFCIVMSYKDLWKYTTFTVSAFTHNSQKASIYCAICALSLMKKTGYNINIFSNDSRIIDLYESHFKSNESLVAEVKKELQGVSVKYTQADTIMKNSVVRCYFCSDEGDVFSDIVCFRIGPQAIKTGIEYAKHFFSTTPGALIKRNRFSNETNAYKPKPGNSKKRNNM